MKPPTPAPAQTRNSKRSTPAPPTSSRTGKPPFLAAAFFMAGRASPSSGSACLAADFALILLPAWTDSSIFFLARGTVNGSLHLLQRILLPRLSSPTELGASQEGQL